MFTLNSNVYVEIIKNYERRFATELKRDRPDVLS